MGETLNATWQRLSLQHELQLSPWQWVLLGALVALLVLPRPAWRLTGMYSTLVHELGHVVLALFTGRFVTGLRLGWDTPGRWSAGGAARPR